MMIPRGPRLENMTLEHIRILFRGIERRHDHTIDREETGAWLDEANREWVWAGSLAVDDLARAVKDFYAATPDGRITPEAVTAIIRSYYDTTGGPHSEPRWGEGAA